MKQSLIQQKKGKLRLTGIYLMVVAVLGLTGTGHAEGASGTSEGSVSNWQLELLLHPSKDVLRGEQDGSVFIYSGLKDKQISQAMDKQFDRIENMMFTQIIVTDEKGNTLRDPETGKVVVEDDGC